MDIKIKIKSWDEVSISLYDRIAEIYKDEALDNISKDVALIALCADVNEDEVWNLTPSEVQSLREQLLWTNEFDFDKKHKYNSIKIGEVKAKATDISDMTMAQYVDFQNYYSKINGEEDVLASLISCFYIPKGCKYNEGYDMAEFTQSIRDNISITQANSIVFFMLRKYLKSIRNTLHYLEVRMIVMEKILPMSKLQKDEMKIAKQAIEDLRSTLTCD